MRQVVICQAHPQAEVEECVGDEQNEESSVFVGTAFEVAIGQSH